MILVYVLTGILAGFCGAWGIVRYGRNLGMIDKPNHRSSHSVATPKGGGIGILTAFLVAALATGRHWALWLPTLVLSFLSLYGDRLHLSHKLRLAVQFSCAGVLIWFAAPDNCTALAASTGMPRLLIVLAFMVMIAGTANYYNFMDGINGIAGITGLVAFAGLAFVTYRMGMGELSTICVTVCGACVGFLILNIPGKVFMGDGGSILLGFLFAAFAIMLSRSVLDIFCYFAFIFPFYADELISVVVRLRKKQSLFKPHRGHLYQLLANELNIAHWKISCMYGVCQLIIILLVLKLRNYGFFPVAALEVVILFLTGYGYALVQKTIRRKSVKEL